MSLTYILILLITGIGVGLSQGILGVGGSIIMVPVLVAMFTRQDIPLDISMKLAVGSNLLVVLTTAISSSLAHHRQNAVFWKAPASIHQPYS